MLKFAPAGMPISTPSPKSTLNGIKYTSELGLSALEVEFVYGVKMKEDMAKKCGASAKKYGVSLSVHAPYYVNLCSDEKIKLQNSSKHILDSVFISHFLGATPVVFHPGFYQGRNPEECERRVKEQIKLILTAMENTSYDGVVLGPELTGKKSAYGNLEEIVELSRFFGLEKVQPVIDFAHYHARTSRIKTKSDYSKILTYCENILGSDFSKNMHCHFSGINFTEKGERNHIPIDNKNPPFKPLLKFLKEQGYNATIVCESPLIEQDALMLQEEYINL